MTQVGYCSPCGENYVPIAEKKVLDIPFEVPNPSNFLKDIYIQKTPNRIWEGFVAPFQSLWETTTKHYHILVPAIAVIFGAAIFFPIVGTTLTVAAAFMILDKAADAASNYASGNESEGLRQFGEALGNTALLAAGLGLGRAGQALVGGAKKSGNAGAAIHLIDEVAAGILVFQRTFQD